MTEKFWNFHTVISELSVLPTLLFTNFILGVITGLGILYGATKRYRKKRKKSWIFWDFTWKITIVSFPESSRVPMSLCEFPWVTMILCSSALSVSLYESPLVTLSQWVAMSLCTVLQKFSKCEVKAAWCGNLLILLPLKF